MPAPADAWAFADMLIVIRTAVAAAKVIANFFIRASDTVALMGEWTNGTGYESEY